jgi:sugar fermentation stimulation protein A
VIFESPLIPGILLRRYARFLSDMKLDSGETVTAHCPNSGSMKGVNVPGSPVLVSHHPSPHRRLQYTWEMIRLDGDWVGINTMIPNRLAAEAFAEGLIPAFRRYKHWRAEVVIAPGTRIDFALGADAQCMVEVKNVTLVENGVALFPDSVTERGTKHLHHLIAHARRGGKSAMLYVIQHPAGNIFSPADDIDPVYGKTLRQAVKAGVKIEAWKAIVTRQEIHLHQKLPIAL